MEEVPNTGIKVTSVAGQVLPSDWLEETIADHEKLLGRTGSMPCVRAVAYLEGIMVASAGALAERSALLNLLVRHDLPGGCIIATAIEPAASEAERLALFVRKQAVAGIVFGAL